MLVFAARTPSLDSSEERFSSSQPVHSLGQLGANLTQADNGRSDVPSISFCKCSSVATTMASGRYWQVSIYHYLPLLPFTFKFENLSRFNKGRRTEGADQPYPWLRKSRRRIPGTRAKRLCLEYTAHSQTFLGQTPASLARLVGVCLIQSFASLAQCTAAARRCSSAPRPCSRHPYFIHTVITRITKVHQDMRTSSLISCRTFT